LSKRIDLYALQAFQRTNGNAPGTAGSSLIITAGATLGDGFQSAPSPSSRSQFAAGIGIVHRFQPAYDRKRKEGSLRRAFTYSAVRRPP
jgi:hypothetical protein